MRDRRKMIFLFAFGLLVAALLLRIIILLGRGGSAHSTPKWISWIEEVSVKQQMPLFAYAQTEQPENLKQGIHEILATAFPWYAYERLYLLEETRVEAQGEKTATEPECLEDIGELIPVKELAPRGRQTERNTKEMPREYGEAESALAWRTEQRDKELSLEQVLDEYQTWNVEQLLNRCYTVDATTSTQSINWDVGSLCEPVLFDKSSEEGYQILIYHTHGREEYAGDVEGTQLGVMEAGAYLTEILEQEYGYRVLHLTEYFDDVSRDSAYSNALPVLEDILEEHPEIQVMIDLHRDEVTGETNITKEIDGHEAARFMFFHGLSYTNERGRLENLPNPYLAESMAFSFQLQAAAEALYPGITRKTYLKGYRYNMHLRPASLLIELGAQNTTGKQALDSCVLLAKALDVVLCYSISR